MRKHRIWLHLFLVLMTVFPTPASAASAIEAIETQVRKVLEVLRNPAQNEQEKEKKILALADEIFDYGELSRLSLANHWSTLTPGQQKEFTDLFGKLLAHDYMNRIIRYTDEKVTFGKEIKLSENTTEVHSEIITKTRTVSMAYRMISEKGGWKVFDVVVEGASLVINYRSQFREILADRSPNDLLRMLREKVREWKGQNATFMHAKYGIYLIYFQGGREKMKEGGFQYPRLVSLP